MGCGISTMNGGDARVARPRRSRFCHARANIVPQPSIDDDDIDNHETTRKEEGFNGKNLKEEKNVVDRKEEETGVFVNNEKQRKLEEGINVSNGNKNVTKYEDLKINNDNDKDDRFLGPRSPSFREYCTDNYSMDRSSIRDYNDHTELGENTKSNSSDDDSTKLTNEKSLSSNKEHEKKERRGKGGFRNVMHKGTSRGGGRNLLNFGCYNSTQSYAESSFNKVVAKTT